MCGFCSQDEPHMAMHIGFSRRLTRKHDGAFPFATQKTCARAHPPPHVASAQWQRAMSPTARSPHLLPPPALPGGVAFEVVVRCCSSEIVPASPSESTTSGPLRGGGGGDEGEGGGGGGGGRVGEGGQSYGADAVDAVVWARTTHHGTSLSVASSAGRCMTDASDEMVVNSFSYTGM